MTSTPSPSRPITIYVDADACPVKNEVYRVAERHGIKETACPIRCNHLALRSFPEYRIELTEIAVQTRGDLVIAAHDRAEDTREGDSLHTVMIGISTDRL